MKPPVGNAGWLWGYTLSPKSVCGVHQRLENWATNHKIACTVEQTPEKQREMGTIQVKQTLTIFNHHFGGCELRDMFRTPRQVKRVPDQAA
ncbi:hypothetical protein SKAU_G00110340 [Synaphobranchus kaupii]|uniref:Uncharacterized protein n=1 Tax=Synaphobranchus kaupii TaxID=118154 RepID=A0A9Q1G0C7_SYNKA|nr:hypothetical protein SKAU_G00110340 [Synaphobranchus kaupii]